MRIAQSENRAHWYYPDGRACFNVPMVTKPGEMRRTDVRDARKWGLLPSVTTVLGMIANEEITIYRINQAILASLTLPRNPGESDTDFAKRIPADMTAHVDQAAEEGKNADEAIRLFYMNEPYDPEFAAYVKGFQKFLAHIEGTVEWTQRRVVGLGYAGTADLLIKTPNRRILFDLKTQEAKLDKRSGHYVFNYYESWPEQLAGYNDQVGADATGNVILDRARPGEWDFKLYTKEEETRAFENFKAAQTIFQNRKKHWPKNSTAGLIAA